MVHFQKRMVVFIAAVTACLILHVATKCVSEFDCGRPECNRTCQDKPPSVCPFGFYKFNEFCYPSSTDVCPANQTLTSNGCRPLDELCPPKFVYVNGVCVNKTISDAELSCLNSGNCSQLSICGPDMVLFNGTCVSTTVASCPMNFTLENGICVRNTNCNSTSCEETLHCPVGMILMNGTCITLTCPRDTFKINGICAKCPVNSHYFNGQCTQCPIYMVFYNGLCVCPIAGQVVHNNSCVDVNILLQNRPPVNNVPIVREVHNVSVPHFRNNHIRKINITNRVNHTDVKNIATKNNGTNINILDLSAISNSSNHGINMKPEVKYKPVHNSTLHTNCCIIIHPRNCKNVNGTHWNCIKRRYHVCGSECTRQKNQTLPQNKIVDVPVPYNLPYSIPAPNPPPQITRPIPIQTIPQQTIVPIQPVQQPIVMNQPTTFQQVPIAYQQEPQILYQQPQMVYQELSPIVYQQPEIIIQPEQMFLSQPQMYSNGCDGVQCGQQQSMAVPIQISYMPQSSCTWPYCT